MFNIPGDSGSGDMTATTYDPTTVGGDAFDMDNMAEGTTTKILSGTERTKLVTIEESAEANNVSDANATTLTDGTEDAGGLHLHGVMSKALIVTSEEAIDLKADETWVAGALYIVQGETLKLFMGGVFYPSEGNPVPPNPSAPDTVNYITNYKFDEGLEDFTISNAVASSVNNGMMAMGDGTDVSITIDTDTATGPTIVAGQIWFCGADVRHKGESTCDDITIQFKDGSGLVELDSHALPVEGTWYELYGQRTVVTGTTNAYMRILTDFADAATQSRDYIEVDGNVADSGGIFMFRLDELNTYYPEYDLLNKTDAEIWALRYVLQALHVVTPGTESYVDFPKYDLTDFWNYSGSRTLVQAQQVASWQIDEGSTDSGGTAGAAVDGGWGSETVFYSTWNGTEVRSDEYVSGSPLAVFDNEIHYQAMRVLGAYLRQGTNIGDHPELVTNLHSGFDYMVRAEHSDGGFPQKYPLTTSTSRELYENQIQHNDSSTILAMATCRRIFKELAPFDIATMFTSAQKVTAKEIHDRALAMLLKTQVILNTIPTAWAGYNDSESHQSRWARDHEAPYPMARESFDILKYLCCIPVAERTLEMKKAMYYAVKFFQESVIDGTKYVDGTGFVTDALYYMWYRFNDHSGSAYYAIFAREYDTVVATWAEIETSRKTGYGWGDNFLKAGGDFEVDVLGWSLV